VASASRPRRRGTRRAPAHHAVRAATSLPNFANARLDPLREQASMTRAVRRSSLGGTQSFASRDKTRTKKLIRESARDEQGI
jgi:hypothetical protein